MSGASRLVYVSGIHLYVLPIFGVLVECLVLVDLYVSGIHLYVLPIFGVLVECLVLVDLCMYQEYTCTYSLYLECWLNVWC